LPDPCELRGRGTVSELAVPEIEEEPVRGRRKVIGKYERSVGWERRSFIETHEAANKDVEIPVVVHINQSN
jgi:hypothetical protein